MRDKADKSKAIEMFNEHFNHLVLYVNQYIHDLSVSEDLVQEMFVRLLETGKLIGASPSFLYVCARHDAFNYLRDKHDHVALDEAQQASSGEDLEEVMAYFERLQEMHEAINRLSPQCRVVLRKIYYENKHYAEVAAEMGVSVNTVKTHAYLALRSLRKDLSMVVLLLGYWADFVE